jgi:adenosylhomocysteinase
MKLRSSSYKRDRENTVDENPNKRLKITNGFDRLIELPEHEKESTRDFYNELFLTFREKEVRQKVKFIVVTHTVPTVPFLLEGLEKIGEVVAIIRKSSDPDSSIKRLFDEKYGSKVKEFINKEYLKNQEKVKELIEDIGANDNSKIIIIDIGGYFAPALRYLAKEEKILGIVEDTENGHQKYQKELEKLKKAGDSIGFPIISAARSKIKDSEDYNVGKAIVDATDHILRVAQYTHFGEAKTILVIGYGKVGSAAAKVAAEKTRGPVLVCEIDPIRKLVASAHSFKVVELEEGIREADIIISCTGNKILKDEIGKVKDNVYIASCTSSDDEFDLNSILSNLDDAKIIGDGEEISQFFIEGKRVNFIRKGNAANFIEKAVHGYFIHGVLGSLMVSALQIISLCKDEIQQDASKDAKKQNVIKMLSYDTQARIASILMKYKLYPHPLVTNRVEDTSKYFFGREKDLTKLKDKLNECSTVIISGEDGYGKSYLAHKYRELNRDRYKLIFYIDASLNLRAQAEAIMHKINLYLDKKNTARDELIELYKKRSDVDVSLGKEASDIMTKIESIHQLKKFFEESYEPYLLIVDNLIGNKCSRYLEELRLYLPSYKGDKRENIIFISENKQCDDIIRMFSLSNKNIFELKKYDLQTVQALFKNLDDTSLIKKLADGLDYHPYALHIIKKYVDQAKKPVDAIIEQCDKANPIRSSLTLVVNSLLQAEREVLDICTFCDPRNIPAKFIKIYCNEKSYDYEKIVSKLKGLSLLHEKRIDDKLVLTIRESLVDLLKPESVNDINIYKQLLKIIEKSFLYPTNEKHAKKYVSSVLHILDQIAENNINLDEKKYKKIMTSQIEMVVDYYLSDKNTEDVISDIPYACGVITRLGLVFDDGIREQLKTLLELNGIINKHVQRENHGQINIYNVSEELANGLVKIGDVFDNLNKQEQSYKFYEEAFICYCILESNLLTPTLIRKIEKTQEGKELLLHKDHCALVYAVLRENDAIEESDIHNLKEETEAHGATYDYWALDGGIEAIGYIGKYFDDVFASYLIKRSELWPNNKEESLKALKIVKKDLDKLDKKDPFYKIAISAYKECISSILNNPDIVEEKTSFAAREDVRRSLGGRERMHNSRDYA